MDRQAIYDYLLQIPYGKVPTSILLRNSDCTPEPSEKLWEKIVSLIVILAVRSLEAMGNLQDML